MIFSELRRLLLAGVACRIHKSSEFGCFDMVSTRMDVELRKMHMCRMRGIRVMRELLSADPLLLVISG